MKRTSAAQRALGLLLMAGVCFAALAAIVVAVRVVTLGATALLTLGLGLPYPLAVALALVLAALLAWLVYRFILKRPASRSV